MCAGVKVLDKFCLFFEIRIYAPAVAQYRIRCPCAGPSGTLDDSGLRGPQRLLLSSQFTGNSAGYVTRVLLVYMRQNHLQEYYHRGNYFKHL